MLNIKRTAGIIALSLLSIAFSCKKDKEQDTNQDFEKKDILTNVADNWIQPGYADLSDKLKMLSQNWEGFKANPSLSDLSLVQSTWKEAYLIFQRVKFIDFGPAMNNGFSGALGTFPCDTTVIEANVKSGSYNLEAIGNISAIGLPSLDYLLFGTDALNKLTASLERQKYVSDVIAKMLSEIDYVQQNWTTYRATFIDGTGTSSTSPFSQFVNAYCKDYDLLKNSKIGIPLGKQSLGILRPEYLEARYSKIGKELVVENFKTLQAVFLGNSLTGTEGKGFDDYLTALDKQSLVSNIKTRFDFMVNEPKKWSTDLEDLMKTQTSTVDAYYTYVQNSLVFLKTDMTSAFGILITYQDNDGD